jgi:hypothetical protein
VGDFEKVVGESRQQTAPASDPNIGAGIRRLKAVKTRTGGT